MQRTLTAAPVSKTCAATAKTVYRAPISGFLDVRLAAARGDWDLGLRDAASGRSLGSSRSFGRREVVQTWVAAGQRILVQGCRRTGGSPSAKVALELVDVKPPVSGVSQLVRVTASPKLLEKLEDLGLDVTHNVHQGYGDVIVHGASDLKLIASLGLAHTVRAADLTALSRKSRAADARYTKRAGTIGSPLPSGRTTYRDYPVIQEELKQLVADHPDKVRPVVIGKTFQGRDIQGVEIANDVNADDGRPVFFLMGVHHAREWAAAEAPMEYAHVLAEQGGDARVAKLMKTERTVIVPVVNVDGYVSSRNAEPYDPFLLGRDTIGADPAGAGLPLSTVASIVPPGGVFTYRRKNCDGAFPDPAVPCELQYGVDNNRNYGNLWGGPGSSPDPTSQSYHGPAPRSEPETQAVWNYTRTHQVSMLMTMHNVAALVLRPPGLRQFGFAPDEARMKQIGDAMADATKYESQYSFQLYDTAGTTEDDTYAATGGYGYTVEIGPKDGEFHAPYEEGFVKQWDGTYAEQPGKGLREALLIAGEAGASTPDHAVVSGTAPAGTTLRLAKSFDTTTSPWCNPGIDPVLTVAASDALLCPAGYEDPITLKDSLDSTTTVPASGRFEWHVNQSTRPFEGGGALKETIAPIPGSKQTQPGAPGTVGDTVDHTFTVPADIGAEALTFALTSTLPEDYDIEVFRTEADGTLKSIGTSGHIPGEDESLTVSPAGGGTYVVRVTYYAALTGGYEVSVEASKTVSETTTGSKESYTLTCERNGKVLETHTLTIDRGQAVSLRLCGGAPVPAPPAGTPAGPPAGT
ncbi:MAG: cpt, partial [Solirubrobacterales bacterium]|nr:cpt [Solirubrobacterales bacterium]